MNDRGRVPFAEVQIPAWGSRAPVLCIDGDRWTVEGPSGPRELSTADVNVFHLIPTRSGLQGVKDGRTTESPPCPVGTVGAEWRTWRRKRLDQIAACRRMGWKVTGFEEPEVPALQVVPPAVDWSVLELSSGAVFGPPDSEAVLRLRARHRTHNPAHQAWQYHGKGKPPDQYVVPGGWIQDGSRKGMAWLPRGAVDWAPDPVEQRPEPRPLADGIAPFWYQSEAVDAVLRAGHGVVEAPCGAGKTGIGTFLASKVDGRVLVLVHTLDLARQWKDRLSSWLPGVSVGQIGGGKKPTGDDDMVVASLSTLARWSWADLESFGAGFELLVADECHHVPAVTWIRVVSALPCRWRVGLTATPKRKDGLERWMALALGGTVYRIDQKTLDDSGRTMAPTIHVLETGHEVRVEEHPAATMRGVLEDRDRNRAVIRAVHRLVDDGRTVLVLTALVDHAESLAAQVGGAALVGKVTAKKRQTVLDSVRAGELRVVVATQLADEGLDLPEVDAVVLAAPSSHKPATRQRIGRACRALEGKRLPVVVDVVDSGQWAVRKWSARRSLYRSLGWTIRRRQ